MHFLCSPWISMHLCTQWDQTIFKVAFNFLSNCKIWILNSSVVIGTKKTVTQSNHHHINILIYRYLYQSMFDFVIEIIGSKVFISWKRWKKGKCDFIKDSTSFCILIGRKSKTYKTLLGIFCKNACMQNCKINSPFLCAVEKKSFKLL